MIPFITIGAHFVASVKPCIEGGTNYQALLVNVFSAINVGQISLGPVLNLN